jgi:nitrate reductase NapAB chaperone NapD
MDTLTFKTSEDVEITRVTLERYGYSTSDDVDEIRLENEDGTIISNVVESLDSKGQAKLTLKKDYRNVDGTLNATIVVRTTEEAGDGNKTIGFKVIDVTSTAKNVNLDNYSPYTYTVVNYQ